VNANENDIWLNEVPLDVPVSSIVRGLQDVHIERSICM